MVLVNSTALARSFAAQLADLRQGIRESWHAEAPEAGLAEWAAFRSSTFFARPRTLCRVGSANARFVTTGSRKGARASSEWAIDARSVFTSRSSTR